MANRLLMHPAAFVLVWRTDFVSSWIDTEGVDDCCLSIPAFSLYLPLPFTCVVTFHIVFAFLHEPCPSIHFLFIPFLWLLCLCLLSLLLATFAFCFLLVRHSSWSAAFDFRGQAVGRRPHSRRLQHSERKHSALGASSSWRFDANFRQYLNWQDNHAGCWAQRHDWKRESQNSR